MLAEIAPINSRVSQVNSEAIPKPVGRPTARTEWQDNLYFEVRSWGKSMSAGCAASGYNYGTVATHWSKQEEWIKREAEAFQLYLDRLEDKEAEEELVLPAAPTRRRTLAKHRKDRFGEVAAEVKVTHVVDIEGALNDLAKLAGVSHLLEAPSGGTEGAPSSTALDADFTVVGEEQT